MKPDFINFIENARKRGGTRFRNQLYIFIVCLALSVFIWGLVKLSRDYYISIDYHLNYKKPPSGLRLTQASDTMLTLKLKVQGFDIFSERLFFRNAKNHEVNLSGMRVRSSESGIRGFMLSAPIGYEIMSQSNFPHLLLEISPDTLFFAFERKTRGRR